MPYDVDFSGQECMLFRTDLTADSLTEARLSRRADYGPLLDSGLGHNQKQIGVPRGR